MSAGHERGTIGGKKPGRGAFLGKRIGYDLADAVLAQSKVEELL